MFVTYKYKLKPTKEQEVIFLQWSGCTRWLWNHFLEKNIASHKETKKFIFRFDMQKELPKLKAEHSWLGEIHSQALQARVYDFDTALRRVWTLGAGFPKFKKKGQEASFRLSQQEYTYNGVANKQIKLNKKQIKLPKIGWVNWVKHRPLEGKLINVTVKQEADKWYICCLCEIYKDVEQVEKLDYTQDCVGIDLGLKEFCVMSDGQIVDTPKFYKKQEKKLKHKQQALSKCKSGGKNREKKRKILRKLHVKIKNQRSNFTHKLSGQITNDYKFIGVESLNVKGMKRNRHLSKAISDQGWGRFVSQLEYKSKNKGNTVVKVDRFYPSSKTCSNCGNKHDMPLKERTYKCEGCGLVMDRDLNAAINIKNEAIRIYRENTCGTQGIYACGDTNTELTDMSVSRHVSKKQEKTSGIGQRSSHPLGCE